MTEHKVNNTEEKILLAAEQEFFDKGFAGARTVEIARQAGVTHAMLHYYFRTKEALFNKVIDSKFKLMGELLISSFGVTGMPLLERIKTAIERHFDFVCEHPNLPVFMIKYVFSNKELIDSIGARLSALVRPLINEIQSELEVEYKAGRIAKIDAVTLFMDIVSINIFSGLAFPMYQNVFGISDDGKQEFLSVRKAECVELIMKRLKP